MTKEWWSLRMKSRRMSRGRKKERKKDESFFSMSVQVVCGSLLSFYSTNKEETHTMVLFSMNSCLMWENSELQISDLKKPIRRMCWVMVPVYITTRNEVCVCVEPNRTPYSRHHTDLNTWKHLELHSCCIQVTLLCGESQFKATVVLIKTCLCLDFCL